MKEVEHILTPENERGRGCASYWPNTDNAFRPHSILETNERRQTNHVNLSDDEFNALSQFAPCNQWRYVADGLPEEDGARCLVCIPAPDDPAYDAYVFESSHFWQGGWSNVELGDPHVYAWKPLPGPAPLLPAQHTPDDRVPFGELDEGARFSEEQGGETWVKCTDEEGMYNARVSDCMKIRTLWTSTLLVWAREAGE